MTVKQMANNHHSQNFQNLVKASIAVSFPFCVAQSSFLASSPNPFIFSQIPSHLLVFQLSLFSSLLMVVIHDEENFSAHCTHVCNVTYIVRHITQIKSSIMRGLHLPAGFFVCCYNAQLLYRLIFLVSASTQFSHTYSQSALALLRCM